jgi:hypothetical protein
MIVVLQYYSVLQCVEATDTIIYYSSSSTTYYSNTAIVLLSLVLLYEAFLSI